MVDRLEELLAAMDDEDGTEEEEWEDVPALTDWTVPAAVSPEENGGEAVPAGDGRRDAPARLDGGGPGRIAVEAVDAEGPDSEKKTDGGLVWRLDGGAVEQAEAAWRRALALQTDEAARMAAETAVERLSAEKGGELARTVRHGTESGLEGLYRQTVQASRPAAQALSVEQAGRTLRAEEPGRTAALTVEELDRAVRRDSRRYDGGMTIY